MRRLSQKKSRKFKCPVDCFLSIGEIKSISNYLEVLSITLKQNKNFWFRGHRDISWTLTPSALRHENVEKRIRALELLRDFRRIAEIKLNKPPEKNENLKWIQLAQHYGLQTRLLDWTESALFALYFACIPPKRNENETDGIVFLLNPDDISKLHKKTKSTSFDAHIKEDLIKGYFRLGANERIEGLPTIAIKPVWNSERLMMQRGTFTLHGSKKFGLDRIQAPSLAGIPIASNVKDILRKELENVGIDEMTLFPELEHACNNLLRKEDLI